MAPPIAHRRTLTDLEAILLAADFAGNNLAPIPEWRSCA